MNAALPAVASPVSSPVAGKAGGGGSSSAEADSGLPAVFAELLSAQLLSTEEIAALAADALKDTGSEVDPAGSDAGEGEFAALPGGPSDIALALRADAGLAFSLPASPPRETRPDAGDFAAGGLAPIAADDTSQALKDLAAGLETLLGKKDQAETAPNEAATADQAAINELAGLAPPHAAEAGRRQPAAPDGAAINTPLNSPQWSNDFSQKLVWMVKNDLQSAQLSLNPANLGPIEVTLSLGKDSASAHFASPFAEVREALESALPRLKEMLAEAGVTLNRADVGAQSQNRFADGQGQRQPAHSSPRGETPTFPVADAVIDTQPPRIRSGIGMVDTFA